MVPAQNQSYPASAVWQVLSGLLVSDNQETPEVGSRRPFQQSHRRGLGCVVPVMLEGFDYWHG